MGGGKGGSDRLIEEFRMDIHTGVCRGPIDRFGRIYVGEKFAFLGSAINGDEISVNLPDHWGGIEKEGGLKGRVFQYLGNFGNTFPNNIASRHGRTPATMPGYGGLANLFFTKSRDVAINPYLINGFEWAINQPFIQPLWVEVQRAPKGLDPDTAMIPRVNPDAQDLGVLDLSAESGGNHAAETPAIAISGNRGIVLSGFSPSDRIRISQPAGETYNGWSPWGIPAYSGPDTGASNSVNVIPDDVAGNDMGFGTIRDPVQFPDVGAWDGYEDARQNFGSFIFSGGSQYRFYIKDTPIGDNTGGLSVKVERISGVDANPSHVIYEVLTDDDIGLGLDVAGIDTQSFLDAGQTFFDEGLGLSFKWIQPTTYEKFVQEVLDHVDATLFQHPVTGLLTLKAIRDDYDEGTLRSLDDTNFTTTTYKRQGWGETINEVVVTYTDPETEKNATVTAQDLGNIALQGEVVSDGRNYYGVRSADLATQLAFRDLRVASSPLATVDGRAHREFWDAVPGEVFKYSSVERGITDLVMRLTNVDYGKPGEPELRFTLVEDVFALPAQAFEPPPTSGWEDPSEDPSPMDLVDIITLPYYLAVNAVANPDIGTAAFPDVFAGILAAEAGEDTATYELLSEETNELGDPIEQSNGSKSVISRGTLQSALPAEATSLGVILENLTQGPMAVVTSLLFIGDGSEAGTEIAVVTVVTTDPAEVLPDQYDLQRGALDTVPQDWPAGTKVQIVNLNAIWTDSTFRVASGSVKYKLLSTTSRGTLASSLAPVENYTFTDRPWKPTRPANVTVNGQGFGSVQVGGVNPIPVAWARRNRELEDSVILPWTDGDVTPEAGYTVTVTAYDAAGGVLNSFPGQTGTSYNLDPAVFGAETMGFIGVKAVSGGLDSLQEFRLPVILAGGWGRNWGYNWGEDETA